MLKPSLSLLVVKKTANKSYKSDNNKKTKQETDNN